MQGFSIVIATIVGLALVVNRVVDFVRGFDKNDSWDKRTWLVLPFVVGLGLCLGWQHSFINDLFQLVPALSNGHFPDIPGQVLSGLIVGAGAGPWHEVLDALNGISSRAHVQAGDTSSYTGSP